MVIKNISYSKEKNMRKREHKKKQTGRRREINELRNRQMGLEGKKV